MRVRARRGLGVGGSPALPVGARELKDEDQRKADQRAAADRRDTEDWPEHQRARDRCQQRRLEATAVGGVQPGTLPTASHIERARSTVPLRQCRQPPSVFVTAP